MRYLLTENFTSYFKLKTFYRQNPIKLLFLDNDFCVFQNYTDNRFFLFQTLPSSSFSKKKKTGHDGYANIIRLTLRTFERKTIKFGTKIIMSKKSITLNSNKYHVLGIMFSFVYELNAENIKWFITSTPEIKKQIIKNLTDNNPYKYRYIK